MLAFWREAGPEKWFTKDTAFDDAIRARFLADLRGRRRAASSPIGRARPKARSRWSSCSTSFRATCSAARARTFAADPLARAVADRAIARGFRPAAALRPSGSSSICRSSIRRSLADQERCVALFRATGDAEALKWAELHADIIRRFGRFPHRNAVLGRATTPEEQAFLDGGGFAG